MQRGRRAAALGRLESLAQGHSPVHRIHPGAQISACLVYIAVVLSFPPENLSGLFPFLCYPLILAALSETPWKLLLGRFLLCLPFVLLGAGANLFMERTIIFSIGGLPVTRGLISFCSILLRAFLTVTAALLLGATIPFPVFLAQLTRMGLPKVFALQIALTWRYVSVLFSEAGTMYTAYLLRSLPPRGLWGGRIARIDGGIRLRDIGGFLGQLLLRSFDRAGRVYQAMECRGFDGVCRGPGSSPWRPSDWLYTLGVSGLALAFRFFNGSQFLGRLIGNRSFIR